MPVPYKTNITEQLSPLQAPKKPTKLIWHHEMNQRLNQHSDKQWNKLTEMKPPNAEIVEYVEVCPLVF